MSQNLKPTPNDAETLPTEPITNPVTTDAPPLEPKKPNVLPILLGALSVIALATAGYFFYQNQQLSAQLTSLQTAPTPTETIQQDTLDSSTTDWQNYTNTKYAYSLKYPTPFKAGENGMSRNNVVETSALVLVTNTISDSPVFAVTVREDKSTFSEIVNKHYSNLIKTISKSDADRAASQKNLGYVVEDNTAAEPLKETTFLNFPGYAFSIKGSVVDDGAAEYLVPSEIHRYLWVNAHNRAYLISYTQDEKMERILSTFAFLEDTSTWKTHKDSANNFTLRYPPDGVIEPLQDNNYTRIQNYPYNDNEPGLKPGEFYMEITSQALENPDTGLTAKCEGIFKTSTLMNQQFYIGEVLAGGEPGGIVKSICFISISNNLIRINVTENHPNTPLANQILSTFKTIN